MMKNKTFLIILTISFFMLIILSACSNLVSSNNAVGLNSDIGKSGLIPKNPIFILPWKNCTDADGDTYNGTGGGRGRKCGPADCNDNDTTVYSGALEICDLKDNDCDGVVDEECVFVCIDNDNDGYGIGDLTGCNDTISEDCDDSNPSVNSNATEICNGIDDNCNSLIDENLTFDVDLDGYTSQTSCGGSKDDCNDSNQSINPSAVEICDNMDNNCNGVVDENLTCTNISKSENFSYFMNVIITAPSGTTIENNYTVNLTLDTSSLINQGKMQTTCNDLIVKCQKDSTGDYYEYNLNLKGCNTQDTLLGWSLPFSINDGTTNNTGCRVYYGNSTFNSPMRNPNESRVYVWYDTLQTDKGGWSAVFFDSGDSYTFNSIGLLLANDDNKDHILYRTIMMEDNKSMEIEIMKPIHGNEHSGVLWHWNKSYWDRYPTHTHSLRSFWYSNGGGNHGIFPQNTSEPWCTQVWNSTQFSVNVGQWYKLKFEMHEGIWKYYSNLTGASVGATGPLILMSGGNYTNCIFPVKSSDEIGFIVPSEQQYYKNLIVKREYKEGPIISHSAENLAF